MATLLITDHIPSPRPRPSAVTPGIIKYNASALACSVRAHKCVASPEMKPSITLLTRFGARRGFSLATHDGDWLRHSPGPLSGWWPSTCSEKPWALFRQASI